ncbi:MAG: putative methyltransferase [Gemmatimonadetes bacterium]|nr:putative methyltransferase [Gemmatimonadota bacterium]
MLLVVCVVLLLWQHSMIARNPIAVALQALAAALMLWARVTFGMRSFHATANPTAGGLVTAGPYRYWRHPIYASVLLFVWAGVLGQGAAPAIVALILGAMATAMTIVRVQAEEQLLRASMPEYASYAARTKRFIPFVL